MTLSQPNPEAPYGKLEDGELEESDAEIHEAAKETEQECSFNINDMLNQITGRGRTPSPPPRPKIPQGYVAQSHRKLIGDDFHQPRDEFKAAVSRQGPEVRLFTDFSNICPPPVTLRSLSNDFPLEQLRISPQRGPENISEEFIQPPERSPGLLPTPTFNAPAIPVVSLNPSQRCFYSTSRRVLMPHPPRGGLLDHGPNVLHHLNANSVRIRGHQQRGGRNWDRGSRGRGRGRSGSR